MRGQGKFTVKGTKIVAAFERFRDRLECGVPVEQRYTVREIRPKLTPRTFEPKDVKNVRAALGISQPVFSQFLGVDVKTVRSWEQGQRVPSGMACRFLEEIEADLEHWRGRLRKVLDIEDGLGEESR